MRQWLDRLAPHFEQGGRLAALRPVYELVDTILYTPADVTRTASHVRDAMDLKRMMTLVVVALMPCVLFGIYNVGYQSHLAIAAGAEPLEGWRTQAMAALGLELDPNDVLACFVHGGLYFIPVLVVTFAVGGGVEVISAMLRKHPVNEGFLVTGMLVPLILPATIPLWQLAVGVAFGVVFGKEVFGGTGMNFLNPALVIRVFLFFAYPAQMSGDAVWTAANFGAVDTVTDATDQLWQDDESGGAGDVDVVSGATWLARAGRDPASLAELSLWDAFFGRIPGSMGETSTAACLLGAGLLLLTRIASWRTMAGVVLGGMATSAAVSLFAAEDSLAAMPFWWHLVLGGFALGAVFMATDPVSSPLTERGRLLYGAAIGAITVLVRIYNPAYPEGMMLAILFMNLFAPLIDHFVVRANVRRREARLA